MSLADELSARGRELLAALDPDIRRIANLPFDEIERRHWFYWPDDRRGAPLHRLDRQQTKLVHRVLAGLLPLPAFTQVTSIMGLDEVLDVLENHGSDRRHRDDYWVTVFGEPGSVQWGFRFEGHHVSLHVTAIDDEIRCTPLFLGANPAVVRAGEHPVSAPLATEERLGFELLHALTVEHRSSAVIADEAPDDIVTRNDPRIDGSLAEEGLPLSALHGNAAAAAEALLAVYLSRFPEGVRTPGPAGARFAWAGADEPGRGHYYRIAGPQLLIELDNTQDGANHVHTVVRDPTTDFGDDLLAAHHRAAH